eukprot:superscaffoldBa00000066_g1072
MHNRYSTLNIKDPHRNISNTVCVCVSAVTLHTLTHTRERCCEWGLSDRPRTFHLTQGVVCYKKAGRSLDTHH